MQLIIDFRWAAGALLLLAGCSTSSDYGTFPDAKPAPDAAGAVPDFPVKIGDTYKVGGKSYTPQEYGSYDEVGYASWYGPELAGRQTANGEIFNPNWISAAHKTLPLPTYVEVTALETGRTILLRVNDRGPFAHDRLIDLSLGAARQLGIDGQGVSGVRVRKVNPNESEKLLLRSGQPAIERIETPDSLLKILRNKLAELPKPKAPVRVAAPVAQPSAPMPPVATGRDGRFIVESAGQRAAAPVATAPAPAAPAATSSGYVVQIAAFGSRSRAEELARRSGAKVFSSSNGNIWRVRYGPFGSTGEAEAALQSAQQRGYANAKILRAD